MTKLSVNLNKVALLRNQRDVGYPDVVTHAKIILEAGAHGITVHPRQDERHIRRADVHNLADFLAEWPDKDIEFNIEGYPSDDFLDLVTSVPCHQVTLVPDAPNQRTSDHGWNVQEQQTLLEKAIKTLQNHERRVSLFLDPVPELILPVVELGVDRIELYTGPYAEGTINIESYQKTALMAKKTSLGINAGHDLSLDNLGQFIRTIPECAEVSIGHAITADALMMGWHGAVQAYLTAIEYGQKAGKEDAA